MAGKKKMQAVWYMVFGLEKTGDLVRSVGGRGSLKRRKLRYERRKEAFRRRVRRTEGRRLRFGPRTVPIVGIMKPRRDFSPFQPYARAHGETISRMTDCANPLAAGLARSASPQSHVVTERGRPEKGPWMGPVAAVISIA